MKPPRKPRVSKTGLMGSATRVHKPKTGKGSFKRAKKASEADIDVD